MKYSIIENHKSQLDKLWDNDEFAEIEVLYRGYHTTDSILKESILFIGINPSYDDKRQNDVYKTFSKIRQEGNEYSRYFKPFEKISKSVNAKWSHLDILYFQETSQKYIDKLLKTEIGKKFITSQLEITKEILENSYPKCIIVCNTKAREFLGKTKNTNKWMNFNFQFDNNLGTYKIQDKNSNLLNTPVFFSSMLSGTRALDIGSRERLTCQIQRVLNLRR